MGNLKLSPVPRVLRAVLRKTRPWGVLLLGLALLCVLLSQISLSTLGEVFREADWRFLSCALLLGLATTLIRALRYGLFYLPRDRWLELYGVFSVMRLVNAVMPMRTGEIASVVILKKSRFAPSVAEVSPVWVFLRVTDVGALGLLLVVLLGFGRVREFFHWSRPAFLAALIALVVAVGLAAWWLASRSGSRCGWLSGRLEDFRKGLRRIAGVWALLRTAGLALLIWATMITVGTLMQMAFGSTLAPTECAQVAVAAMSLTFLPIRAPLGIGTGELAWAAMMVLFGLSREPAVALAIAVRVGLLALILTNGLLGFCLLLGLGKSVRVGGGLNERE